MTQLDTLTRTLKGNKHWLVVKPNNNHLQGTITRDINLSHKAEILAKLGNVIKDTEDYEIIISAISKILDYHIKEFPEGMPKKDIPDLSSLSGLVQHPTNPNNVTIDSFVFARLKKNIVNGFVIQNDPTALASYSPSKHNININVEGIQSSINRNIATNGKYNYKTTDDYVYSEFEKSIIHEFLHSISDNGNLIGFANYKAADQHIGMNEATTEKIATMIASPKNYRKTNLTLLRTKRSQFLTNIDSNSGYSFQGIVNLIGMLTGVESDRKTIHKQYILGQPADKILRPDVIDNVDTIYKFSKEQNPINQANLYYTKSMESYYSAIGITNSSNPTSTKTIYITFIDGLNIGHNIPVNCSIYPGNIFKYDIPNNSIITDDMVDNTFSEKNIQTQPAGKNGARSAIARYITGYLNTNNISPYAKVNVNLSDIKSQPATWKYLIASKTQDDISSWLYTNIKTDINALQANFSVNKFNEILRRINAIGDNIVYSIPNDTAKYNLKNIGYVSRLVSRTTSTVPVKTITEYYNIRRQLLTIAKLNENKFARLSPKTTINLDGVDITFSKDGSGSYVVDKKQPALIALFDKMKKYPILATIQNIDNNYLTSIVEEIVNKGIGFNELDEFSTNHVEKTQITYQTICSYLQNEKYKQKDYILTSNILFEYNGVQLNKFIPIKITTQDKHKLQLANSTLRSIQDALHTPYTLTELNAVIATYLVPKFNANISDFTLSCNLQHPDLEKALKSVTKDRFIKIGSEVMAVPVAYTQDVYVIGGNAPIQLDNHIEKYLTSSKHIAIFNSVQDKKGLIKLIRLGFNHYIHSKNLSDKLKDASKSKPLAIDIANMVDYVVANSPDVAKALQSKQPKQKTVTPTPTPSGNNQTGNNTSPNSGSQAVSPYDYFKQYIGKDGKFNFTPYTMWQNTVMNPNYYYQMFQQYQFMQYYGYMMSFYGGYQNYPMIQQMNMGTILMPGSIMYGYMPQMASPMMMPYVFNGYNNFYGYNSYMQGGFRPNMMPFYQTNNQGQVNPCTLSKEQITALTGMVTNIPVNPANTAETVKALQTLKAQLDTLIAKYGESLTKPTTTQQQKTDDGRDM